MQIKLEEALQQEYDGYLNNCKDISCNAGLNNSTICFVPNQHDLSGEKVEVFNIDLTADEMCLVDGYFLLYRNGAIRIYRYDTKFKCVKVRKIESHLLIFLIKRGRINKQCRFLFYNVLLNLIKSNEKKYDQKLNDIMCSMCVDWITSIKFGMNGEILCVYRNRESRVFNAKLQVISSTGFSFVKDSNVVESREQTVTVKKNGLEITRKDRSFKNVLAINEIKQHSAIADILFLLTNNGIKALRFGK
ncbi:hypothetical protein CWI42_010380 [Ordospora colligata]|uniref:Uncharacterized protein n=1 Tax=Ordospora colligata OC4 TaxID=1354746 RepID=A0A0B2UH45_9MICR|nr:uncharacterized protein M896_010380 [Ordospora colligata OC4]KHN70386.1 hypothetical protein M896_010380 [Ordospora colligata OC4]TBU17136.1 hypothetical protein CWI41_010380 [Ordospora colligata]TBU17386.1 hypothetical protein CWI40_010380 [Ordospora colligata]TBU19566.1 hypothetical protein CWI42_010380 [Ordospora colligata]